MCDSVCTVRYYLYVNLSKATHYLTAKCWRSPVNTRSTYVLLTCTVFRILISTKRLHWARLVLLLLSQQELLSFNAGEAEPFLVRDETSITVNVFKETLGYPNYHKHRLAQFTCLIKLCALFN